MSDTTANPFEHILYEMKMYLYSQLKLIPDTFPNKRVIENMFVDSRAIHLRNLADFFEDKVMNKSKLWHFSDFVNDVNVVYTIKKPLFVTIKDFTSKATCHLSNQRLEEEFKDETLECVKNALPEMIKAIRSFFKALDDHVKEKYKCYWENEDIQEYATEIRKLLPVFEVHCGQELSYATTE